MSKSQIKRLHQQQELEKVSKDEQEEEEVTVQRKGPANRFAFFDDEDEGAGINSDEGEKSDSGEGSSNKNVNKKKAKKNKKKGKKAEEKEEETENQMLARLAALNAKEAKRAASDEVLPSMEELMKVDMKQFDMSAEIKKKLGKAFKEVVTPGQPEEYSWPKGKRPIGKIVKNKASWFSDKNIGLSMKQSKEENGVLWFTISHSNAYREIERLFTIAQKEMNIGIIQQLFAETPYHLNSLLLIANVNRMNEDLNTGADMIERGIWYVDQHSTPTFEPFNFKHRMDYTDYENRAFFLLLHRHMLNAAHKRCWETAFNTAKMIFKLDPVRDPLAIMSIIDAFALKAKNYTWIIHMFEVAKKFKKLHLLPNWPYSVALARFHLAKSDEEMEIADRELQTAIRHFPLVVVQLMDLLQIHPDSAVMNCKMLTSFVADNEKESLKLLVKIYAKQTEDLWKETLLFLERATRHVATSTDEKEKEECEEWRAKRNKMYHSRSPNVDRLAQLLEIIPSSSITDPVPPANGRCEYDKDSLFSQDSTQPNESLLAGLLHSLLPQYNGEETLEQQLEHHRRQFFEFMDRNVRGGFENIGDAFARWMDSRNGDPPIDQAELIRLENEEPFELPEDPENSENPERREE